MVTVDEDLKFPGHEEFMESAKQSLDKYNSKLAALMSLYGLKNEGEVITGCLVKVNARLSGKTDEKFEVAQMIQASVSSLRKNSRHEFYEEFGDEGQVMEEFEANGNRYPDEVLRKASAWYVVTYSNEAGQSREENRETGSDVCLLSFPWVVDRILSYIKRKKQEERERLGVGRQHALKGVSENVADQAAHFFDEVLGTLTEEYELRVKQKNNLSAVLGSQAPSLSLCGSSLTGICAGDDKPPPIQIYAHVRWGATEQEQFLFLQRLECLTRSHYTRSDVYGMPPHLILEKIFLLKEQYRVSADSSIMLKSAYISLHVQRCPSLLHLLLIMVHWGRRRHLIGRHYEAEELVILFLLFCEKKGFVNEVGHTHCLSVSLSVCLSVSVCFSLNRYL